MSFTLEQMGFVRVCNRLGNNYESNLSVQINKILSFQGNKSKILDEFSSIEGDYNNLQTKKLYN